jgi:SAM-dependent methyltransferase
MEPSSQPTTKVYATARGPFAKLASPLASRARERRHARFFALTSVAHDAHILDLGCGALGLRALEPELDITGVDLVERPGYPGPFVRADATVGLPFSDDEFDLVYCSSVIEHVVPAKRVAFAAEARRVGRAWFVQTPALGFPVEPHSLLPFAHWLPSSLRRHYWRLGAAGAWEDISLLSRRELEGLFGAASPERLGPFVKSWVCIKTLRAQAADAVAEPALSAKTPDVIAEPVDHEEQQEGDPN